MKTTYLEEKELSFLRKEIRKLFRDLGFKEENSNLYIEYYRGSKKDLKNFTLTLTTTLVIRAKIYTFTNFTLGEVGKFFLVEKLGKTLSYLGKEKTLAKIKFYKPTLGHLRSKLRISILIPINSTILKYSSKEDLP